MKEQEIDQWYVSDTPDAWEVMNSTSVYGKSFSLKEDAECVARLLNKRATDRAASRLLIEKLRDVINEVDGEPMARMPQELWKTLRATLAEANAFLKP